MDIDGFILKWLWRFILVVTVCVQIKEKLLQLTDKRKEMIDKWEDRWEWLRLSKTRLLPDVLISEKPDAQAGVKG